MRYKECNLHYHADQNATIEILTLRGTINRHVPAAGTVVNKQKERANVCKDARNMDVVNDVHQTDVRQSIWTARTTPIFFSDCGSIWEPPAHSSLKRFENSGKSGVDQIATAVRKKPCRLQSKRLEAGSGV